MDSGTVLFSVIIPYYNTPIKVFQRTLESVIRQKTEDYELLVIDDGSEKHYSEYLDSLSGKFEKLQIIHQDQSGVSAARNKGILKARGTYVIFVDSDDVLSNQFLTDAKDYIESYNPDVIYGTICYAKESNDRVEPIDINSCQKEDYEAIRESFWQNNECAKLCTEEQIEEVKKCLLDIWPREINYRVLGTPCAAVYKTDIAKKALFRENVVINEDQLFNREILMNVHRVLLVPDCWYYYIQYPFSALHVVKKNYEFLRFEPYWSICFELNKKESANLQKDLYSINLLQGLTTIREVEKMGYSFFKCRREMKKIMNHPLIKDSLDYLQHEEDPSIRFKYFLLQNRLFLLYHSLFSLKEKYRNKSIPKTADKRVCLFKLWT